MPNLNCKEWNFYFGRGSGGNRKRNFSKAHILLHNLAHRYSDCRQTEKRIFAKKEVFDKVVRNGGAFFQVVNRLKQPIDITADTDEVINKIMQVFRDINKHSRKSSQPQPRHRRAMEPASIKISSSTMLMSRPKRRCRRPSIIEPPIIDCLTYSITRYNTSVSLNDRKIQGQYRQNPLAGTGASDDAFDKMKLEPPKLKNSFSTLIMTDEITADLPRDSQKSINHNLHDRVQRLENLVGMLMQQKNDEMELLLK